MVPVCVQEVFEPPVISFSSGTSSVGQAGISCFEETRHLYADGLPVESYGGCTSASRALPSRGLATGLLSVVLTVLDGLVVFAALFIRGVCLTLFLSPTSVPSIVEIGL